jgi:hypothetical protein
MDREATLHSHFLPRTASDDLSVKTKINEESDLKHSMITFVKIVWFALVGIIDGGIAVVVLEA